MIDLHAGCRDQAKLILFHGFYASSSGGILEYQTAT